LFFCRWRWVSPPAEKGKGKEAHWFSGLSHGVPAVAEGLPCNFWSLGTIL
jgi:hypothetical protein